MSESECRLQKFMATKGITNRQRIIEAADRLFYVRGYNRTSFSDISDATGLPRGNFYYYFKTKEDILDAVMDSRVESFGQMLKACTQATDDPHARLLAFVRQPLQNEQVLQYGCPFGTLSAELGKSPSAEASRAQITAVFDVLRHWCAGQFGALGVTPARADQLALELLARMQGMTLIASIYNDREFLQRTGAGIESWLDEIIKHEVQA
ncbi:MAG: TetR/AcrR family transcriptional regulator, transcriptional repressor for nem operon [Pseudomonadota bacterium]|nr:TetR/AcrR family transcriptional regulator, transcriptional repressor for nem operon [Pseudomonadota bacterium]